ncbi:NAD(P)-dependent oxidoreductase [Limnoraphis robusta Tam1]|uniref:NAD(P)-dependent oxidoreductase n=1 Tax=Limnoraphis robusta CCNP1315 TaxID=3110306 RepID=A0ABU5TZF6_9CYAN|nr:NAD(P)-dependent oxidoreductase [Limnoraphis robusta]MEA5520327.1 NAD(P)-dependent oxidoreductase [Limnoraphis robusta CCNP1315]MEA5542672.1 NAD(P)-dependent oxidoreductase [Limnoraphis robusta Tam1]MEA5548324.1 NAD(P)-dependent oxidoreductase [Limnoraphis robusta CCNP1324]
MKLFVTGASGFLGQYIVAEALRKGHQVSAVIRPKTDLSRLSWYDHPEVKLVRLDLREMSGLIESLQGVDNVIHLAAVKAGDFYTQFAGTVIATENLLTAMKKAEVKRLTAISTFSVYDYLNMRSGQILDENSSLEKNPLNRDEYAQTKLIQEELYRNFERDGGQVAIIRPGMIYGRDYLWNACLGAELGESAWLRIGANAIMPLTYVENCAEAIVIASECEGAVGHTINIVDDDLPTQNIYAKKLMEYMEKTPRTFFVSWTVIRLIARSAWLYNHWFLKGKARLPGIFVPAKLHARFKPLRYSNHKAKEVLNWKPKYSLQTAFERSCSDADLLAVPVPESTVSKVA